MGQQQLLLIILGVIIVGVAVTVGIIMFNDSAVENNRDAVQRDLVNLSGLAMTYYYKPASLGGGGRTFTALTADAAGQAQLAPPTAWDNDDGHYSIKTAGTSSLVVLLGVGKVQLPDGTYPTYTCRARNRKYLIQQVN
jgi:hypothetical protein